MNLRCILDGVAHAPISSKSGFDGIISSVGIKTGLSLAAPVCGLIGLEAKEKWREGDVESVAFAFEFRA